MSVSDYLTDATSHLLGSSFWQTNEFELNVICKVQNVDDGMQIYTERRETTTIDINHYTQSHKETQSSKRRWHRNGHKTITYKLKTATKTKQTRNAKQCNYVICSHLCTKQSDCFVTLQGLCADLQAYCLIIEEQSDALSQKFPCFDQNIRKYTDVNTL